MVNGWRAVAPYAISQASFRTGARFLFLLLALLSAPSFAETDPDTGLVFARGYEEVKAQCTVCHSARLITQNRADRQGWLRMIRWMQQTEGLWPLGDAEAVILGYLADNYGPLPRGSQPREPLLRVRRAPLNVTFE